MTKFKAMQKLGKASARVVSVVGNAKPVVTPITNKVVSTVQHTGHELRQGYIEGKADRLEARQITKAEKARKKAEAQAVKDLESQISGITIDPDAFNIAEVMPKLMKLVTENPKLAGLVGGDQS
jgi:hypothetical protein